VHLGPLGPLGFDFSQHRRTPRPSVEGKYCPLGPLGFPPDLLSPKKREPRAVAHGERRDEGKSLSLLGLQSPSRTQTTPLLKKGVRAAVRHMAAAVPAPNPALWEAALMGRREGARQLLLGGANVEERGGGADDLSTPLQAAVKQGHAEVVQLLLEHGADMSATDDGGRMPLHLAASFGDGFHKEGNTDLVCTSTTAHEPDFVS
jgi:hypothetical protein